MLRLIKLPSRTFSPPKSVWDVVYINKNHQPTRAATRRENWARHGQVSKVKVEEIVPTVKEYQLEARAEYEWFDTLQCGFGKINFYSKQNFPRILSLKTTELNYRIKLQN